MKQKTSLEAEIQNMHLSSILAELCLERRERPSATTWELVRAAAKRYSLRANEIRTLLDLLHA